MSTKIQIRLLKVSLWLWQTIKRIDRRLLIVFRGRLRTLKTAAVILFILFFVYLIKPWGQINFLAASILDSAKYQENISDSQTNEFLGGPIEDEEPMMEGQTSIDFTLDDTEEDIDLNIVQANSLVASSNPSPTNPFSYLNKEIITYTVQSGDNPESIAVSFGINTRTVLWANNLRDGDLIRPGDKLIILPINGVRHKVVSGDTITSLAKKYRADEVEIIQFNSLPASGALQAGQEIIVPGGEKPVLYAPIYASYYESSNIKPSSGWLIMPAIGYNWGRLHSHNGVDISNKICYSQDVPVYAAAAGEVVIADAIGWNGGYGQYVKIKHSNGAATLYAHNKRLLVSTGQSVKQGQVIALMGSTGRSTGCHVHFEVRGAANSFAK